MSRLAEMQARFQQKQMAEKEEKLLKLYESQQQRVFERVGRGSAGSNGNFSTTTTTVIQTGKVRQMFDERRQKAGIDRSYPLEPLKNPKSNPRGNSLDRIKPNKNATTKTTIKTTVQKSVSQIKNGKPVVNKREVIQETYNNNGDEETYVERRYKDENDGGFFKNEQDLVAMLNSHNLNDNLDDEEMPNLDIEECEEPAFTGKLSNVGGRLKDENDIPSNNNTAPKPSRTSRVNPSPKTTTSPAKKVDAKPPIKKSISNSISRTSPSTNSSFAAKTVSSSPSPRNSASPINTPRKTTSEMSKTAHRSAQSQRSPSAGKTIPRNTASSKGTTVTRDDLVPCKFCTRRFAEDRLQIHEDICARTGKKRRKQYDALKHRLQGTELEPYVKKGRAVSSSKIGANQHTTSSVQKQFSTPQQTTSTGQKQGKPASTKKTDWRRKHEEFIAAIRSAKMAQQHIAKGGKVADLPPPPPSYNPDYVQCPHCGRRFNETAAERHIPKCATYLHNKSKNPPSKGSAKR